MLKNQRKFKTRVYDLRPGKKPWEQVGVVVMEVIIYLPEDQIYGTMKPRVVSCKISNRPETAFKFTGAQIAPNSKELNKICKRLTIFCNDLVEFIRKHGTPKN